jgi:ribonuclease Y
VNEITLAVGLGAAVFIVLGVWWLFLRRAGKRVLARARRQAAKQLEEGEQAVKSKLREADLLAKEKLLQARGEFEKAARKDRLELERQERRLNQREDDLDKRLGEVERREKEAGGRERDLDDRETRLTRREQDLERLLAEERTKLEQISGLTAQQARDELLRVMENEARVHAAHLVKRIEDEARESAHKQAQRIIGMAVQRSASDYVSETTVSVVVLPNDEMKGRIIGREGRNIRAFEQATGVDVIIDDTPEAVVLSAFDPVRREVARLALERLIEDGRIHPGRIEETVDKATAEVDAGMVHAAEEVLYELGLHNVHPEIV